jgi:hypothetical protein
MNHLPKLHPNSKSQKEILANSIEITYKFSEFSFKIHFESEGVPMAKVLPLFKPFKPIFYFDFFEQGKVLFKSVKV